MCCSLGPCVLILLALSPYHLISFSSWQCLQSSPQTNLVCRVAELENCSSPQEVVARSGSLCVSGRGVTDQQYLSSLFCSAQGAALHRLCWPEQEPSENHRYSPEALKSPERQDWFEAKARSVLQWLNVMSFDVSLGPSFWTWCSLRYFPTLTILWFCDSWSQSRLLHPCCILPAVVVTWPVVKATCVSFSHHARSSQS